jgi:putative ABC transport system permease protein
VQTDTLRTIWRDLVHGARSLARARTFTFVCVVSLGIGMSPVIAVPYAAHVVMTAATKPPGVVTEGLVEVLRTRAGSGDATSSWSYPDFIDLRTADTGLTITGWTNGPIKYATGPGGGSAENMSATFVSASYFRTLGATFARGRGFDDTVDDRLLAEPVVVVTSRFWQERLDGAPDIIGTRVILDDVPHLVVGVTEEGFAGDSAIDGRQLFLPLERHPRLRDRDAEADALRADRSTDWVHLYGRMAAGVDVAQASARLSAVASSLARQYPETNELAGAAVAPYDGMGVQLRQSLTRLQVVALTLTGIVMLVVCANISGMMLVRSAMRERELSIRQAIGASRGRLIRALLSEAVVLATMGGTLAAFVLFNAPPTVAWLVGTRIPARFEEALRVDFFMIAVCAASCLVASLACGLLPAIRFSRPAIISSLKDDVRVGGVRVGRIHRLTTALQVAIAVPLIVMAGISLDRVRTTATSDLGFAADDLYTAPLALDDLPEGTTGSRIRAALDTLARTSGVVAVTLADGLPLDFNGRGSRVALQPAADVAPAYVHAQVTRVGDDYLKTMGIPLVRGRGFTKDDAAGSEKVAVISQALATVLFPNADATEAIGKRLFLGADPPRQQTLMIVGVTADFPTSQMDTTREQLIVPMAQHASSRVFLIARSAPGEPPAKLTAAVEHAIHDLDPDASRTLTYGDDGGRYARVLTGVWLRNNSVSDFLVRSGVSAGAGSVILMLAALGIYGVVGLMVATRTREIAVRIALGAQRRRVMLMILLDVVKLVMPGIGVGLLLTVALMRLNSENMGIPLSSVEPVAYSVGGAVALAVAVLAGFGPARRAASVQPMIAMRSE